MIDLYLIRHAESTGNVDNHIIGGQSNHLKLTPRGEDQALRLGKRLAGEAFQPDLIISSIAVRAAHTARIASKEFGYSEDKIEYTEEMVEHSQGDWEGKPRKEYYTKEAFLERAKDPLNFKPPGGESLLDVEERAHAFLEKSVIPRAEQYPSIALFSHGMTIRCIVRKILDAGADMAFQTVIHNTSITQLHYGKRGWQLVKLNDFVHLHGTDFIGHYG
ncbi:MAG: histidine phosphatase family protein [Bacteroidota bacterium]